MTEDGSTPKLHIDSDWKAEAAAEKEKLAAQEQAATGADGAGQPGPEDLPEPTFVSLLQVLASQAMMGLGAYSDPNSGRVAVDPDGARFHIDLIEMLEQKTEGNLSDDEKTNLTQILAALRSRYVEIMQLLSQQVAQGAGTGATPPAGGQPGGPPGGQGPGGLQMP